MTDLYDCSAKIHSIMRGETVKVITWERLYKAFQEDPVLLKLMEVVLRGFPQSGHDVDEDLKQYHKFSHNLHSMLLGASWATRAELSSLLH